jgi:hypothetical protein
VEKEFKKVLRLINNGEIEKTETLYHVDYYLIEKTSYSFHFYAVYERNGKDVLTEMLYDLRNQEYFIKRNGKELRFSVQNLDTVIPRDKDTYLPRSGIFYSRESAKLFFDMVSVEDNKGMYEKMMDVIGAIGGERTDMSSRALIRLITDYNKLELLYKAGFDLRITTYRIVRELVYTASRDNVRKIHQIFDLTKSQLKFLQEYSNAPSEFYNALRKVKYLEQKDMDTYRGWITYVKELEEKYDLGDRLQWLPRMNDFAEAMRDSMLNTRFSRDFFGFIMEFNHPNPRKLLEYLLFECLLSQGMEFNTALSEYRDYYRMCEDLNYERFDRYPKHLKTLHDIVSRNYRLVSDKVAGEKFIEAADKYKHFETEMRSYSIVVPSEPKDLVNEGNVLQHCVGSYVKNIVSGKTQIMFLREKGEEDRPLVTVEIKGNKLVQARGQGNRLPDDKEKKALRTFARKHELEVCSYV